MKRYTERHLHHWYHKKDRMPLILRGARQVGKSTLVKLFCESNQLDLFEINCEITKLHSINQSKFSIDDLLDEIQIDHGKSINSKSLIFFDEIQESPKLLQLLRYFYEKRPDIAVITAGSLLEIALKEEEYSFPVGRVEFCYLGPMTFFEFLDACKQELLRKKIEQHEFSPAVHEKALEYFMKYLFIGGMPKAVASFVTNNSLTQVREIQQQIVQTYVADFPKYSKRIDVKRVARIFSAAATMVGEKVIFQNFDRESKSREIKRAIELLTDARVLLACTHSESSGVPLLAGSDDSISKLFFLDVGLMNCILRTEYAMLKSENITKGTIAEQFVAQHLAYIYGPSLPPTLSYWLRDKGVQKGEVDFLLEHSNKIFPVEVKADKGGRLKSLFYFAYEKKWKDAIKLSCAEYSKQKITHKIHDHVVKIDLVELPLYGVETILLTL